MFIDTGILAVICGLALFGLVVYYGRQQGLAWGAQGALDMLEEQGLIRQVEYNGDTQIIPVYEKEEK